MNDVVAERKRVLLADGLGAGGFDFAAAVGQPRVPQLRARQRAPPFRVTPHGNRRQTVPGRT
jgi:hypothetical protein